VSLLGIIDSARWSDTLRKSASFRKALFATGYGKTIAFVGREVKCGVGVRVKTVAGDRNGRFMRRIFPVRQTIKRVFAVRKSVRRSTECHVEGKISTSAAMAAGRGVISEGGRRRDGRSTATSTLPLTAPAGKNGGSVCRSCPVRSRQAIT